MRTAKIPLPSGVYRGLPTDGLPQAIGERMVDCYLDETGTLRKRPGLTLFKDLAVNQGVQGTYWWGRKGWLISVANGRLFKTTGINAVTTEITGGDKLLDSGAVSFDSDSTYLIMANGGRIVLYDGTNNPFYIADQSAPTAVSHVAMFDGYLLALQRDSNIVWYSKSGDIKTWNPLWFSTANFSADNGVALFKAENEIAVFGRDSIEFWYNDGQTPFRRLEYTTQSIGCLAPGSIVYVPGVSSQGMGMAGNANGVWVFMDNLRRIVILKNRNIDIVSMPFDDEIKDLSAISDAKAFYVTIGRRRFYILNFATQGETYVMDMNQNKFAEWGTWSADGGSYGRYIGNTYTYAADWNVHIIGDATSGKLYKMNFDTFLDNGSVIRAFVRTGPISHGVNKRKRSEELRIRLRRGAGDNTSNEPKIRMRWRDDNKSWGNWRGLSMGKIGETEFISRMQRMGMYRTRQYEFSCTENSDFMIADIEEDIQILSL